jgi:hypothetical protein
MCEHDPETVDSEREARDAYDEFEERMRRIGEFLRRLWHDFEIGWHGLGFHEQLGHVISIATLIALFVYAGYTIKMYHANRESADQAIAQVGIARDTLKTTTQQFYLDQRPWISPSFPPAPQAENQWIRSDFTMVNSGKTPALNADAIAVLIVHRQGDALSFKDVQHGIPVSKGVLFPNVPVPTGIALVHTEKDGKTLVETQWTKELQGEINKGDKTIFGYGELTYLDMLDTSIIHHATFCQIVQGFVVFPTTTPRPRFPELERRCIDYNKVWDEQIRK